MDSQGQVPSQGTRIFQFLIHPPELGLVFQAAGHQSLLKAEKILGPQEEAPMSAAPPHETKPFGKPPLSGQGRIAGEAPASDGREPG
jgi:hypothetical protein